MATPAPTKTNLGHNAYLAVWTITTADHTGEGIDVAGRGYHNIQFSGTWGSATAKLEGSIDNSVWIALSNAGGTEFAPTADGMTEILETPRYIRPRLTTVGSGATIVATLISRTIAS